MTDIEKEVRVRAIRNEGINQGYVDQLEKLNVHAEATPLGVFVYNPGHLLAILDSLKDDRDAALDSIDDLVELLIKALTRIRDLETKGAQ